MHGAERVGERVKKQQQGDGFGSAIIIKYMENTLISWSKLVGIST